MPFVGGLRARLIRDSFEYLLRSSLGDRGWFDANRRHEPVTIVSAPADWDEPMAMNTIAVNASNVDDIPGEMGSNYTEDTWTYYVDFYAENEVLGMDVANDIRDILRGKLPSIGREATSFDVYDFSDATPPVIFQCELENVIVDRARGAVQPWEKFWFAIRCDVIDAYGDEFDPIGAP